MTPRLEQTAKKIFNIYSQPGRWHLFKYIAFLFLLFLKRLKSIFQKPLQVESLEVLQPLSSHPKAFDAVFFQAVSQNGIYICGGVERRHSAKANALVYVVVPELGLLESVHLPKTLVDADPSTILSEKKYSADGISFQPVEPMKKWLLSYCGKMRVVASEKLVDVKFSGKWKSDLPFFFFDRDINPKSIAKAVARETWSKSFFKALKTAHQSHYEQMGYFNGTLTVDGKEYGLKTDAFRDHSFGYKRDWTLMHRYIYHMLYLEDGTRVSIGVISQPCTTSLIEVGYILLPNKTIHAIENCNLLLYQHAEKQTPAKNYAFSFTALNNAIYDVKINVIHESVHYKGNDVEAKLIERFLECQVNGISGKGISEWHYNNLK